MIKTIIYIYSKICWTADTSSYPKLSTSLFEFSTKKPNLPANHSAHDLDLQENGS